jgi:hypothetical protein
MLLLCARLLVCSLLSSVPRPQLRTNRGCCPTCAHTELHGAPLLDAAAAAAAAGGIGGATAAAAAAAAVGVVPQALVGQLPGTTSTLVQDSMIVQQECPILLPDSASLPQSPGGQQQQQQQQQQHAMAGPQQQLLVPCSTTAGATEQHSDISSQRLANSEYVRFQQLLITMLDDHADAVGDSQCALPADVTAAVSALPPPSGALLQLLRRDVAVIDGIMHRIGIAT